ncbi:uncharacterized protein isoform X2 [Notothenia coriiceps]|uniref:Uncharacterized protein LOC104957847 isoform X1 n=1 Tax=Notothenia coriiceps TaxID=8208 RepID=A0A6I9PCU9_9TELE|nr:PREDICTED: uncharacterized protein LOC104957847 isoform X1 [Notothenia coriiceps]XP_010783827.1 PREDICTED: uncharacterized protein LOC104957847 isoform X2 [Notothenia coriiceps]
MRKKRRRVNTFRRNNQRLVQRRNMDKRADKKTQTKRGNTGQEKKQVESFLLRDENSRLLPGKKDIIGREKKMQRRVLAKSLVDLHKEYLQTAGPHLRLSYRQFVRYRPFYVTEAKSNDRNTCACYQHENLRLLIDTLSQRGILPSKSLSDLLSSITCNTENLKCMERTCTECCFDECQLATHNLDDRARWEHWAKEDVVVGDKTYKNWVKKTENGTVKGLVEEFQKQLEGIAIHQFKWLHQAKKFRHLKEHLKENQMVLHVDFSENYACKLNTEIQSFHFGGNRRQASIHTVVACTGSQSYATISDSVSHSERAVWAHLKPVAQDIMEKSGHKIDTMHVLSDGPVTQYRNKANCYLLSSVPYTWGLNRVTWNYSERAHGKGAPDGVGGAVKRMADNHVHGGQDIQSPKDLYDFLIQKEVPNIQFKWINEADIQVFDEMLPPSVPKVPGILTTHQILSFSPGEIFYRTLSCFCRYPEMCSCFSPKKMRPDNRAEESGSSESFEAQPKSPESHNSGKEMEEEEEYTVGKFVIVKYENKPFVGQITQINEEHFAVNCMEQVSNKNIFKWPAKQDCILYSKDQLVSVISEPEPYQRAAQLTKYDWLLFNEV